MAPITAIKAANQYSGLTRIYEHYLASSINRRIINPTTNTTSASAIVHPALSSVVGGIAKHATMTLIITISIISTSLKISHGWKGEARTLDFPVNSRAFYH